MPDSPDAERLRLAALQEELEAARRKRDTYQALLKDLPEVFEGKFRERVRPLQQRNEHLLEEGLALREQIRRALPPAAGATGQPASLPSASPAGTPDVAANSSDSGRAPSWLVRLATPGRSSWGGGRTALLAGALVLAAGGLLAGPRLFRSVGSASAPSGPAAGVKNEPAVPSAPLPSADPSARSATASRPGAVLQPTASREGEASLTIRTTGTSWLEVRGTEDAPLFSGALRGVRVFPLSTPLRVRAGRAHLVFVQLSGQPERRLGPSNFFRWVTFQAPSAAPSTTAGSQP